MGENEETLFTPLKSGVEYNVYGLMFYSTRTDFLIYEEGSYPLWAPSNLFEILDDTLPGDWGCVITEKAEGYCELYDSFGINSICGYLELIRSYEHYVGIIEGADNELQKLHAYRLQH
ncbi:hypothetical protein KWG64_03995 [Rahnella sp. PD12R]|uniref:hypothetical protein n=1 Tax=Rahnella sp. PD12R TaxID=2855688 RepID=UPI001C4777BD|nr:hypothetical protein [Rahnella sp. PD12R]MBV6817101.1 hypothetical protein [Rahnella sp. PD12R]